MLYCMSISHNSRKVCTDISKAIKTALEESTKFTLIFGTDQYRPRSDCLLKSSLWVICQYRYNRDTAPHRNSTNVLELGSLYLGMHLVLKMCQCIFFFFFLFQLKSVFNDYLQFQLNIYHFACESCEQRITFNYYARMEGYHHVY